MTENPVNIELIPWVHNIFSLYHQKVAEYIKNKIPKNSYLALEISPKRLDFYNSVFKFFYKYHLGYRQFIKTSHILKESKGMNFAYIDVLNECYKKNIKIIPIENRIVLNGFDSFEFKYKDKKYHSILEDHNYDVRKEKYETIREEYMAKNIAQTLIHNPNTKNLYVLTGAYHTGSLQKKLQKLDVPIKLNVNLNTSMFSDERIVQYVLLKTKQRAMYDFLIQENNKPIFKSNDYYNKQLKEYIDLRNQVNSLLSDIKNNFIPDSAKKIHASLQKRNLAIRKRLKRKLRERNVKNGLIKKMLSWFAKRRRPNKLKPR